jgi:hypothetical protein
LNPKAAEPKLYSPPRTKTGLWTFVVNYLS